MKEIVSSLAIFFIGAVLSFMSRADNRVDHHSNVKGVSLLWLYHSEFRDELTDGQEAWLVSHCNGENGIFVYELGSKRFSCRSTDLGIPDGHSRHAYRIDILGVGKNDLTLANQLNPSGQGIFTISAEIIQQRRWNIQALTSAETAHLIGLSKYSCPEVGTENICYTIATGDLKWAALEQSGFNKSEVEQMTINKGEIAKLSIKIIEGPVEVSIVPVAVEGQAFGLDTIIVSSVFSKSGDAFQFVGYLRGSLIRVGPDINKDGFPEILMDRSAIGQIVEYDQIFPSLKSLVSYHHF